MISPIQYFQIMTPDTKGILRPFEVNQFNETDPFFETEDQAKLFIADNFFDSQQPGEPERKDLVLIILPVFLCRFK